MSVPSERSRFVDTSAGAVRYVQAGQGVDVVLLHGAMTCLEDMLLGPFDALAARFRVTAFDRPGHGATQRVRLRGAPRRQAAHIHLAMRALGLERPIVVGQSFGATLALDLALEHREDVRGVVAISPIAFPELRLEHLLFGPRAMLGMGELIAFGPGRLMDAALMPYLWQAIFAPQPMPARFRDGFPFDLATGPSQMVALGEEAVLALPDLAVAAQRYAQCQTPAIVIAGQADVVAAPWRHASRLARLLPAAELKLLGGQGHMLHHFAIEPIVTAVDTLMARVAHGR